MGCNAFSEFDGEVAGIGKSISKKLASQGLNVVLVALQDQLLEDTTEELSALYPELSFRKVLKLS